MVSFSNKHRTICAVLTEIKEKINDPHITLLCNEAIGYAQSMSNKLAEYKAMKNEP